MRNLDNRISFSLTSFAGLRGGHFLFWYWWIRKFSHKFAQPCAKSIIRANPAASANTRRRTRSTPQSRLAKKSAQTGKPKAKGSPRQHAKRRSAVRPKTNNTQTQLFSSSAHTSTTREFRSKFANTHCAVKAKQFLPHPRLTSPKQKLADAVKQTTRANKHQPNKSL